MKLRLLWLALLVSVLAAAELYAQDKTPSEETCSPSFYFDDRIVTPEELDEAVVPKSAKPWWTIGWPCRKLYGAMESGLIKFEKTKLREKLYDWQRKLAAAGFRPLFGGLGEGSGFGLGTIYDYPHRTTEALHAMGRWAFLSGYQEFSLNFDPTPFRGATLNVGVDYQWRPNEPYYGFGRDSSAEDRASFALRQSSFSVHWDQEFHVRIRAGTIYSASALKSLGSTGGVGPSVDTVFGELPGLDERVNLQSVGAYLALDGYQGDYRLGGRGMFGGSWQQNLGGRSIRYTKVEAAIEGRVPVFSERSVLIGLATADLLREGAGTTDVPFYLYPRIGGSATLRGFPLDRFYGRNAIVTTLEYRWLLNPNVEAQFFLDSGQIFQHTSDLRFLDWYRNYGFGVSFRTAAGTAFRIEAGYGDEGFSWHITFGDRPIRPFGSGPVRYPTYRP